MFVSVSLVNKVLAFCLGGQVINLSQLVPSWWPGSCCLAGCPVMTDLMTSCQQPYPTHLLDHVFREESARRKPATLGQLIFLSPLRMWTRISSCIFPMQPHQLVLLRMCEIKYVKIWKHTILIISKPATNGLPSCRGVKCGVWKCRLVNMWDLARVQAVWWLHHHSH